MILVTGASGKTGRAIVRALVSAGQLVRGLVRRADQVRSLRQLGAHEVVVGDMLAPDAMELAARGAGAVYHICPNVHPQETDMGEVAISAARAARVDLFGYHSVLHPQTEDMPHHWQKLRVEEKLIASGLSYVILQPAPYMQNILAYWGSVVENGVYPVPYSAEARLSIVDLEDVAEVVATVLSQPDHMGATYELSGPEPLSQQEVADTLQERLGRPVSVEVLFRDGWEKQAREAGLGDYQVKALVKMFEYYDRHGLCGNPRVLEWLLGRPPTSFAEFVERIAQAAGST